MRLMEDISSCYVYLMQDNYNNILDICKVPYKQSSDGGWRLKDFILENLKAEEKSKILPDYKFRCYYLPFGSILPKIKNDTLDTIWKLLEEKHHGILEKEISFKNAAYAVECKQSFFFPDGSAFNGKLYNPEGWSDFIEKDNKKQLINLFDKHLKNFPASIAELVDMIKTTGQKEELLSLFYQQVQDTNTKQGISKIHYTLFPVFFSTVLGDKMWTDKDMLCFIRDTGMEYLQLYYDSKSLFDFYKRQGMEELIGKCKYDLDSLRSYLISNKTEVIETHSVIKLKQYCQARLNDIEVFTRLGLPDKIAQACPQVNPQVIAIAKTLPGYQQCSMPEKPNPQYVSWEDQNKPADNGIEQNFEQFKTFWDNKNSKENMDKHLHASFTPSIKY